MKTIIKELRIGSLFDLHDNAYEELWGNLYFTKHNEESWKR